jgi:4'-phosphopantetheinyl transferase
VINDLMIGYFPSLRKAVGVPAIGETHLWWIDLDAVASDPAAMSGREMRRARRLRCPRQRARFIARRAAMRAILADYVGSDARSVALSVGCAGKPELDPTVHRGATVAFNMSHSAGLAVLAIARAGHVGVDFEADAAPPGRAVMLDSFSPAERAAAIGLDEDALARAFRIGWTRKEALLKASGAGFAIDPAQVEVGLMPSPRVVQLPPSAGLPIRGTACCAHLLTLPPGAAAGTVSLARIGAPVTTVRTFRFCQAHA